MTPCSESEGVIMRDGMVRFYFLVWVLEGLITAILEVISPEACEGAVFHRG